MPYRTVNHMINGVVHEIMEEYNEEEEAEKRARRERLADIISQPASEAVLSNIPLMQAWIKLQSAWDDIEHILLDLFTTMTRSDYSIARAAFFSQRTHAARRSMIEEMSKHYLQSHETEMNLFINAIKRVHARSDIRNKLMHGLWGWSINEAEGTAEVARFETKPSLDPFAKIYPLDTLLDHCEKMISTREQLFQCAQSIKKSKSLNAYWTRSSYIP